MYKTLEDEKNSFFGISLADEIIPASVYSGKIKRKRKWAVVFILEPA